MSVSLHIRSLRALGNAFEVRAKLAEDEARGLLLADMAMAHHMAADKMAADSLAEATDFAAAHSCTVDHAAMKQAVCPCCSAKRG